jgi:hypothetical protein
LLPDANDRNDQSALPSDGFEPFESPFIFFLLDNVAKAFEGMVLDLKHKSSRNFNLFYKLLFLVHSPLGFGCQLSILLSCCLFGGKEPEKLLIANAPSWSVMNPFFYTSSPFANSMNRGFYNFSYFRTAISFFDHLLDLLPLFQTCHCFIFIPLLG